MWLVTSSFTRVLPLSRCFSTFRAAPNLRDVSQRLQQAAADFRPQIGANDGKTLKCRAAVAFRAAEPLKIEEIDVDPPRAGEVRVRLFATGVCHTDKFTLSGEDPEGLFPVILGHEGAGIVESVGEGVKRVQPGDTVVPLYTPECGTCKFCVSGKTNLCQKIRETQGKGVLPDGTSRFRLNGEMLHMYMGTSTFSQYTVLPEIAVSKMSGNSVPFERVCLLGCGITTGWGAAVTAGVEEGNVVGVWGLGGVGLSVVQAAARECKASRVVAVDPNEDKWELAKKFGATDFVNPNKVQGSLVDYIVKLTDGGLDFSFECVGNVQTMRDALEACHKGWGVSTVIGVAGAGQEISTRPFQLVTGRVWRGSAFGGVKGSQIPELVKKYEKGELDIDNYITNFKSLDEINDAFDDMVAGKTIRSVIIL